VQYKGNKKSPVQYTNPQSPALQPATSSPQHKTTKPQPPALYPSRQPSPEKKNRTFNVYEDSNYMMMTEEDERGKEIEKVYSSVPPSHFD
jgi:hypothetical protein